MDVAMMGRLLPGVAISLGIALVASALGGQVPIVGGSIFALALGMAGSLLLPTAGKFEPGLKFSSKKLLRAAIILLGTGLSITQVLVVGRYSLFVMVFTLSAAFGSAYVLGSLLGVNWKLSSLISAGTGICGGSAIATISPIIDADETDTAYAMSATFVFDVLMIVLFPLMGKMMNLSDLAYGLWTGTAVNDTSSVVAAGYAFSDAAGDFATIVKLTRTTSIVPIALIFSVVAGYTQSRSGGGAAEKSLSVRRLFPWFILLFALAALINTVGLIPAALHGPLKQLSKLMMAMALAAIGLKTDLRKMLNSGVQPMVLGFLVSLIVVVVSIGVQYLTGQI